MFDQAVSGVAHFLHVAWLFPMSSAEAASWVQAVGTLLAFALTGYALVRAERLSQKYRAEDAQKNRLEAAASVSGWVSARGKELRGGIESYVYVRGEITNYGDYPVRNICAWVVGEDDAVLSPSRRFHDLIAPRGDSWRIEWVVVDHAPIVERDFVTLQFDFTLGARRYRYNGDTVVEVDANWRPERWERQISAAWWFLDNPPGEGTEPVNGTAVGNVVKEAVDEFVNSLPVGEQESLGQQMKVLAAAIDRRHASGEERLVKSLLGKLEGLIAKTAPTP
jgi:hypothetical protein